MDHEQASALLPGYLDGELSLSESLALDQHMAQCDACRLELARQRAASAQLRQADLRVAAPAELVKRITAALPGRKPLWRRLLGAGSAAGSSGQTSARAPLGLALASLAALAVSLGLFLRLPSDEQRLAQELVNNNIRSLQVDHLFDVASTDQHTVKPWFGGKLDFAPPVVDLAAQGYPLKGGRVDYLAGQRVAVLVYRDKLHPISLFVWPGAGEPAAPRFEERLGYHIAHWRAAGMNYWAITDAGASDLSGFVSEMQKTGN
ncbi:anti-sigma factor [Bordetella sp. N]|nr:anti-sigma factor [Bordetella sp. N]